MNKVARKKVGLIGLGYVGLPTMVGISKSNHYDVVGYDTDPNKILLIQQGIAPIEDEQTVDFLKTNSLTVSTDVTILKNAQYYLVCVPTPVFEDHSPNYSFIISAIKTIARFITVGSHIFLESTVNPGTSREIIVPILKEYCQLQLGKDYNLAHCPERINPGDKDWHIHNINRNIGSISKKFNKEAAAFYRSFLPDATIAEVSSIEVAEATKIVENIFRDVNIALVNELAKSFDTMGIDLYETLNAAANKPFGFLAHWPGCGVGGHCIAVDPYYLIAYAAKSGFDHRFLRLAREINNSMPEYTIEKLIRALNNLGLSVKGTKIALLGLSYKANIGDLRESPAVKIQERLIHLGANLTIYDPYIRGSTKNLRHAVEGKDVLVIATAHKEFIDDLPTILKECTVKVILDGRNCLSPSAICKLGITYIGIGR